MDGLSASSLSEHDLLGGGACLHNVNKCKCLTP